jgi:hypothetical protein
MDIHVRNLFLQVIPEVQQFTFLAQSFVHNYSTEECHIHG